MPAQSAYNGIFRDPNWNEHNAMGWPSNWKWPSGVPANQLGTARTADGTAVTVLADLVELFQTLINWTEQKIGYKMTGGGYTGGYSNRKIAGTGGASSHSRGRAIDINAQKNPQSSRFVCDMPVEMVRGWVECGFYWGGHYRGAPYDTMHFFYNRNKSEIPAMLAKARALLGGTASVPDGGGGSAAPSVGGGVSVSGLGVKQVQQALINKGHQIIADGIWGPATLMATQSFQMTAGLAADGWVGPDTWNALNTSSGAPGYPLSGSQVFGRWNEPGGWAKHTRSGNPKWDGDDVRTWIKMLQQRLIMHGVVPGISDPNSGWADGLYEKPTTDAVKRFQQARGGMAVDGMVGKITWDQLWK